MKKIKLKITGIHCKSCKTLIEEEVSLLAGVKEVKVDTISGIAWVVFNESRTHREEIVKTIENLNYEAEIERTYKAKKDSSTEGKNLENKKIFTKKIIFSGTVLVFFVLLYFILSRFRLFESLEKLNEKNLSYGLIFFIGLLASFHCIGMCGGIVMAYTSRFCASVKGNKSISIPHINYNLGRILSYTLTGFILGGMGSFFGVNKTFTGTITLLAGLFMIAVGLSLITKSSILDKITGILPASFARLFTRQLHAAHPKTPILIGFLNGFMPCGPLQAMQIYALASGSALTGGLSMAAYGLGTVPLMLGFGNIISMFSQGRMKQIMKISGVIVILLGAFTLNRSLASFWSNAGSQPVQKGDVVETTKEKNNPNIPYQEAKMDLTYRGYEPSTLTVKKGIPVRWTINVKEMSGCTNEIIMPTYNIKKKLQYGENVIEFTPKDVGEIKFSCWMKMVWGKFIVK